MECLPYQPTTAALDSLDRARPLFPARLVPLVPEVAGLAAVALPLLESEAEPGRLGGGLGLLLAHVPRVVRVHLVRVRLRLRLRLRLGLGLGLRLRLRLNPRLRLKLRLRLRLRLRPRLSLRAQTEAQG